MFVDMDERIKRRAMQMEKEEAWRKQKVDRAGGGGRGRWDTQGGAVGGSGPAVLLGLFLLLRLLLSLLLGQSIP